MAVTINMDTCTGCATCVPACPVDAITMVDGKAHVNETCVECGACLSECPVGALSL